MKRTTSAFVATVPTANPNYKKWGDFYTISAIISSGMFMPCLITGPSGNGKTTTVMESCADHGREMIRVQISPETDENDLIGGYQLIDGNTVFVDGPVITAMRTGSVLLLDELDRGSNQIMCLQGIMEGTPFLIKKTGEVISGAPGFTIWATANTKGRGSPDGLYSAASIIDDAFLERFVACFNVVWAPADVEIDILTSFFESQVKQTFYLKMPDRKKLVTYLVKWAGQCRTAADNGMGVAISTRKLLDVIRMTVALECDRSAVEKCTNRFDTLDQSAVTASYNAIRPSDFGEAKTPGKVKPVDPDSEEARMARVARAMERHAAVTSRT